MTMVFEHFNFAVVIVLMMTGLFAVFASHNMIKKLVGLSVFQTSVFLLYISLSKVTGGRPPVLSKKELHGYGDSYAKAGDGADAAYKTVEKTAEIIYSNPLPHVLILTAIVVGVATLAIGLALVVRTREEYGSIEEDEIDAYNYQDNLEGVSR
ncbi:MAG: cation:proton antiporter subunit C [Robiginitomaculum sp.]|nr:cation:proton antiporter subunit C [Robiginitomaculum sp.]